eukprot:m.37364 g.37364  ORF g.37364 m.37364 type:complete len:68 (+) comp14552_c0_seq1:168-371(+)
MDTVREYTTPLVKFGRDSRMLVNKCTKPDRKEFQKTVWATAIGFGMMGMIGFVVKLIHIPINQILVS